jgi:hypothetical protein
MVLAASKETVSHTGRNEFKRRLASMTENLSPLSTSVTMKPQPWSSFVPTVRELLDSQITTANSGKGGNTQKTKVLRDSVPRSTSSFRRSVELSAGNWKLPTTSSVSRKLLYHNSKRKTEHQVQQD